ncbi:MAG TPA: ABC transporter ATP-binding protein [Planctomycetaceae bacterium]|nr:ABC transporter ATP-binding protein [Planctomycetaceae bacterium]
MVVIQLENVGKRYWLRHRAPDRQIAELLNDAVRSVFRGQPRQSAATREEFWALRDVSLQINAGDVIGLLGRNGAGKSTLLKLISWIMAPTTGRVGVRGRVGCLLEVGTGFHHELTGRENIFLNGAILGMGRREIRWKFDQIVDFAEVEAFLDTAVKHYSSGMFVRLAFAVAAMLDPEILIVDEVLSVGDAAFQKKCHGVMQDAVRRGCTCLMVSHNLPSIVNLCRRAILLQSGRVVADGPPQDVVQQYLSTVRGIGGRAEWPDDESAPGNAVVRLRSVRVIQDDSEKLLGGVDIAREIQVEICYGNLTPDEELYCALALKDHVGTTVLTTSSAKAASLTPDAWAGRPHPVGQYRSVCRIPANFLNEGRYSISVTIGRGISEVQAVAEDVVAFDVHDTGEMRGLYFGQWPGVIRPKLAWDTERRDDAKFL